MEIKRVKSKKMTISMETSISKRKLLEPGKKVSLPLNDGEYYEPSIGSSSPRKDLENFALDQMSLKIHMQDLQKQLKKEFMEIQEQKQLKKNHQKMGVSSKFQKQMEKNRQLDDLLGLESNSPNSKVRHSKKMEVSSPVKLRKMSLDFEIKSPKTAEILKQTRLMSIFSPNVMNGNLVKLNNLNSATIKRQKSVKIAEDVIKEQQKKSNFVKIKEERMKSYNSIVKNIESRQKTFARFGFKTNEKDECQYLKPILDIFWGNEPKGTMLVIDLWAKRNMRKYLDSCKLTKDKLILSKIASIRQRKSDFLRDSKKLFETAFGVQEEANKMRQDIKDQEKQIFNHFKKFLGADYQLYQNNGVIKKLNPASISEILDTPCKGTPKILKEVFVNAFPGIFAKNKLPEVCSCNTEETKTMTEEKSIFSNINPMLKGLKDR